ncbi:MAG TPA: YraN family protein [Noviherbaspirillum sp.]|uniref:YraN family protein n=1 Tax=Noviherbaspirillum sp. TaxID=1926288 RepID=UPI002D6C23D5|nr:YraN family protein [Noviherbaspirillum sp.]HYD97491.1 YraN family protein [Noviherbaspirillum sp.]
MGLFDAIAQRRTAKQAAGDAAEDRALSWLQRQGLRAVERNFRCKGGEIDLVMQDGDTLVFVEVRQRADRNFGGAAASVTPRKQARLVLAAQTFLQRYRNPPPCRFDVIAIDGSASDGSALEWLKNAIEA